MVSKVATKTSTASRNNDKNIKQHVVYKLVDGKQQAQYVGRTKNLPATEARHKMNPNRTHLKLRVIRKNLNWYEARGWEQYYINDFTLIFQAFRAFIKMM